MLQVEVNLNKLPLNWQAPVQPVRQEAAGPLAADHAKKSTACRDACYHLMVR